jgi:2-dehydropantoate 2-reductase
MLEFLAIAHASGISEEHLSLLDVENEIREQVEVCEKRRAGELPEHWPSMLLDRMQGKPLELEVILGEVVRTGQARGIECPRLALSPYLSNSCSPDCLCRLETLYSGYVNWAAFRHYFPLI